MTVALLVRDKSKQASTSVDQDLLHTLESYEAVGYFLQFLIYMFEPLCIKVKSKTKQKQHTHTHTHTHTPTHPHTQNNNNNNKNLTPFTISGKAISGKCATSNF